jgi:pimeloyl-ACP methyl ester carboxylesterase
MGSGLQPFTVQIPDQVLEDLRDRLRRTRFPPPAGTGWERGVDLDWLRAAVRRWADGYDWRAAEREINRWPNYRVEIGGAQIHFVHARGGGLPLLVTHGWPGSFLEMQRLVPILVEAGFDVVVPSLPGYGFSAPPARPGVNCAVTADLWAELMSSLGYARFGAQGGDMGAQVSTWLALRHPERLLGLHLNYIPGSYKPDPTLPPPSDEERAYFAEGDAWVLAEGGYSHQQRTRPDTLGVGLDDSPAGLLAWIAEKLRGWSADFERSFTLDDVLTHVMVYWVTRTATSSVRLYLENKLRPVHFAAGERVRVPTAIARFPLEAPFPPLSWIRRGYDVERYTEMPRGGHFAAWEEPELLAADLRAFFAGPQ